MSYSFNASQARSADSAGSIIRETGKYVGTITRAESLKSGKGTRGLGLSFSSNGQSASYLDLWTHNDNNEELPSLKTVQAILGCLRLRGIEPGEITFEKWDVQTRQNVKTKAPGFPALMGKDIGLLLRKELSQNQHGEDRETMGIFGVFEAKTEFTVSEILDRATEPKKLAGMVEALMAKPVYDRRKKVASHTSQPPAGHPANSGFGSFEDEPF